MADLRVSVHVVSQAPVVDHISGTADAVWSPETCTLVYTATEAVLVDTAITINQNETLIAWIRATAPGRRLRYIYITHGHADHFLGLPQLRQAFPEAQPVASAGTLEHIQQQLEEPYYTNTWVKFFGSEQLYAPQTVLPTALAPSNPDQGSFSISGGTTAADPKGKTFAFHVVECGHSDTHSSTVLWQPDLRLAVCGDVVYGSVHQMLLEARTAALRREWLAAIDAVAALKPRYVVPGHRRPDEVDGVWHLAETKRYIEEFERALKETGRKPDALVQWMVDRFPDRWNPMVLSWGAIGSTFPDAS